MQWNQDGDAHEGQLGQQHLAHEVLQLLVPVEHDGVGAHRVAVEQPLQHGQNPRALRQARVVLDLVGDGVEPADAAGDGLVLQCRLAGLEERAKLLVRQQVGVAADGRRHASVLIESDRKVASGARAVPRRIEERHREEGHELGRHADGTEALTQHTELHQRLLLYAERYRDAAVVREARSHLASEQHHLLDHDPRRSRIAGVGRDPDARALGRDARRRLRNVQDHGTILDAKLAPALSECPQPLHRGAVLLLALRRQLRRVRSKQPIDTIVRDGAHVVQLAHGDLQVEYLAGARELGREGHGVVGGVGAREAQRPGGHAVGNHRVHSLGRVDRRRTQRGLDVEGAAGRDQARRVGNVHVHPLAAVGRTLETDGVVDVPRGRIVDRVRRQLGVLHSRLVSVLRHRAGELLGGVVDVAREALVAVVHREARPVAELGGTPDSQQHEQIVRRRAIESERVEEVVLQHVVGGVVGAGLERQHLERADAALVGCRRVPLLGPRVVVALL